MKKLRISTLQVTLAIWLLSILGGMAALSSYSAKGGKTGALLTSWPIQSKLEQGPLPFTLLVFLHPQCPCSLASMNELERLMPALRHQVNVHTIFYQPKGRTEDWVKGRLWKMAQAIPELKTEIDSQGFEMNHFKIETSGEAMLFSRDGTLLFRGGITPARGHEGNSLGREMILSSLRKQTNAQQATITFGCSMKEGSRDRRFN